MKILLSALIIAVAGCGRAPEIKKRKPLFTTTENQVRISEKADLEIIRLKYKNKINLRCDFFIDNRANFDLTTATSFAGFTANIAAGESPLNLISTMANGQKFTTGVRVKQFDIFPEITFTDENGVLHQMKDSPMVELIIRGRDVLGNRDQRFERTVYLNEKNSVIITDLYPKKYPHILKCKLETTAAEGYEADYKETQPVKAEEVI